MGDQILPTLLILSLGLGIFVRLMAKEKHRRERHLQFRLEEQLAKIREGKELAANRRTVNEKLKDELKMMISAHPR